MSVCEIIFLGFFNSNVHGFYQTLSIYVQHPDNISSKFDPYLCKLWNLLHLLSSPKNTGNLKIALFHKYSETLTVTSVWNTGEIGDIFSTNTSEKAIRKILPNTQITEKVV